MRERLTIFVIVGMRTDEHSLRSQVGIGVEIYCLVTAATGCEVLRSGNKDRNN